MPDSAIMLDEVIESYNEGAKAKQKIKKQNKQASEKPFTNISLHK